MEREGEKEKGKKGNQHIQEGERERKEGKERTVKKAKTERGTKDVTFTMHEREKPKRQKVKEREHEKRARELGKEQMNDGIHNQKSNQYLTSPALNRTD